MASFAGIKLDKRRFYRYSVSVIRVFCVDEDEYAARNGEESCRKGARQRGAAAEDHLGAAG